MKQGTIEEVISGAATYALICARCEAAIDGIPDESVDFGLMDCPYGLGDHEPTLDELVAYLQGAELKTGDFMDQPWDLPSVGLWRKVYRKLKPGAWLAAFGGPQTDDLLSIGLRAAGFERRDAIAVFGAARLAWVQAQGRPNGINVSKAIDEAAGVESRVVGWTNPSDPRAASGSGAAGVALTGSVDGRLNRGDTLPITVPTDVIAAAYDGYNTTLSPRHEPVLLFRKPLARITSEQLRSVTKWDHWCSVRVLWKATARAKAAAKFGVAIPKDGEAQVVDRKPLHDAAVGWTELRWRPVYRFKRIVPLERRRDVRPDAMRQTVTTLPGKVYGDWQTLAESPRRPFRPWTITGVAANAVVYGTGGINIDACRVGSDVVDIGRRPGNAVLVHSALCRPMSKRRRPETAWNCACYCLACRAVCVAPAGGDPGVCSCGATMRWACPHAEMDRQSGVRTSGARREGVRSGMGYRGARGDGGPEIKASEGGASRFMASFQEDPPEAPWFYEPKANRAERDAGLDERNDHVAIKPHDLIVWLAKLIGRPGAVGLTCYAGAGSEVAGMLSAGCRVIGIEMDPAHVAKAEKRIPALVRGERRRAPASAPVAGTKPSQRRKARPLGRPGQLNMFAPPGDAS